MLIYCFSDGTTKNRRDVLMELVKKPCSPDHVTASPHFTDPLRDKVHACDGDTNTFYYSEENETDPFLTIQLDGTYRIKKITVVNVHTGSYCQDRGGAEACTRRLDGAKVEVMHG